MGANTYSVDSNGNAIEDGQDIPGGSGTAAMAEFNGEVLGEDATSKAWYTWNQTTWNAAAPSVSDVTSTGTLAKNLSPAGTFKEDGDAIVLTKGNVATATLGTANDNLAFIGASRVGITGGGGTEQVLLAGGNNTITAGKGSLDVTAASGADAYTFHAGDGLLTIEDFSMAKGDALTIDQRTSFVHSPSV